MREQQGDDPITTARFRDVATRVLDALLEATPEQATDLGDHRFDDRLTDWSAEAAASRATMLTEALAALDDVDDTGLIPDDRVDLEILRTQVTGNLWELTELRPHERDPLLHLPGEGLYPLIAREAIPAADRLRALTGRLDQVPDRLATAREVLHDMPRIHVETAIVQARGTRTLLTDELDPLLSREPELAGRAAAARDAALAALAEHTRWLEAQLPVADGDPRLGEQAYAARLWYTLDTETGPDALLTRAESDLQAIEEEIAELASDLAGAPPRDGQVREMLDRSAALAPVTDATILPLSQAALTRSSRARPTAACRPSSRSRPPRTAGTPSGWPRSTASTTATCCALSPCTRRCRGTSCSWPGRPATGGRPRCARPPAVGRSSRAGRCTPRNWLPPPGSVEPRRTTPACACSS
jgi:uncharacterized protein (DUF885 family)